MPEWETTEDYHRKRLKDPNLFDKFRITEITTGIKGTYGKLKSTGKWEFQNIMFDVDKFTLSEAKDWLKKHKDKFSSIDMQWNAPYTIKETKVDSIFPGIKTIVVQGSAVDDTTNANGWAIESEDLDDVANQLVGKQIRINHSDKFDDIKGKVISAERKDNQVNYEAEISADAKTLVPLIKGYGKGVSIRADANKVICSKCGSEIRPIKTCECEGSYEIIKDFAVKELSLVADPAYDNTFAEVVGFSASVSKALSNKVKIEDMEKKEDMNMADTKETPSPAPATETKTASTEDMTEVLSLLRKLVEMEEKGVESKSKKPEDAEDAEDSEEAEAKKTASAIPKTNGAETNMGAEKPKEDLMFKATKEVFEHFKKLGVTPNAPEANKYM